MSLGRFDRCDGASPPKPRASAEQRRALAMLSPEGHNGVTRSFLVAHGFGVSLIASRVNQGLATLMFERMRAGDKRVDVGTVRISDAGRHALAAED
jgi:hypothetical protein